MIPKEINKALWDAREANDLATFQRLISEYPEGLRDPYGCCKWLHDAIKDGQMEFVRYFIEEMNIGVDEIVSDMWKTTALDTAVQSGSRELAEWLLDRGAQVNRVVKGYPDCVALKSAVLDDDLELVKLLVERGADINAAGAERRTAYMLANQSQQILEFLRSHGGVDPRETTPPDHDSGHERILEFMKNYAEEDESWGDLLDWKMEFPGEPPITLYCRGPGEESNYPLLFTVGASDVRLEPESGQDFGEGVELIVYLPRKWRVNAKSMNDPKWNWPMVSLVNLARRIHARGKQVRLYEERDMCKAVWSIEMNGDPPQPIAPGTQLCGWLLLGAEHCVLPDFRGVSFDVTTPIYREEADFLREKLDYEPLLRRFVALRIPRTLSLDRRNAVVDWPKGKPEPEPDRDW